MRGVLVRRRNGAEEVVADIAEADGGRMWSSVLLFDD